jgi:predicted transposase YbfD/YdcC
VPGQVPVGAKGAGIGGRPATTNEHKAALRLLDLIPVEGKRVTGDAMFCQRDLSKKIDQKRGSGSGR